MRNEHSPGEVPDMPILVHKDEATLSRVRAAAASAEHLQHDLEDLRKLGKPYVVLHEGRVVATGASPDVAWSNVKDAPKDECVLVHVPRPGETYFF